MAQSQSILRKGSLECQRVSTCDRVPDNIKIIYLHALYKYAKIRITIVPRREENTFMVHMGAMGYSVLRPKK